MPKVLPSIPSGGRFSRGRRVSSTLAEINVIPLVDVMLVLLIIFMVAAPMLQRGVEVQLPVATRSREVSNERVFVDVPFSYRKDQRVFLGKESVGMNAVAERIRQMMLTRTDKQVYLRTDGRLTVQDQIDVLDRLKIGGVENVVIVTRLPGER